MVPLIFAGIGGGNLPAHTLEWAQQYLASLTLQNQQQQQQQQIQAQQQQLQINMQEMQKREQALGVKPDGEMVALYQQAAAYIYPSFSEGFGLEILEAMIEGTPVIAAEASCLPEIGGKAALYFDPRDADQLAGKRHRDAFSK